MIAVESVTWLLGMGSVVAWGEALAVGAFLEVILGQAVAPVILLWGSRYFHHFNDNKFN